MKKEEHSAISIKGKKRIVYDFIRLRKSYYFIDQQVINKFQFLKRYISSFYAIVKNNRWFIAPLSVHIFHRIAQADGITDVRSLNKCIEKDEWPDVHGERHSRTQCQIDNILLNFPVAFSISFLIVHKCFTHKSLFY